jgi:arylsulfatase A-like enzyme
MDAHAPYPHGPRSARAPERYLAGVAADDTQIGHVLRVLESNFAGRWVLIVSADHGEAFGDHGTFQHSKTLYEELIHVPLLVMGSGISPRVVDQRVGLVDLGPTLLDLFGAPTPATFEGQSLIPLIEGREAALDRPLIAETRLRQSITTPEGLKVIEDLRRKTVEVYDLTSDPGEAHDLFDEGPARAGAALATLRAFFTAHTLRRPGYRPRYEP